MPPRAKSTPAATALKAEAEEVKEFSFFYDDEIYTITLEDFSDLDIMEAFEENRQVTAMKTLLGEKQWATFKTKKRTVQHLAELMDILFEKAKGLKPGE